MSLPDGIHKLTRAEYDAITDRLRWSDLKVMAVSPAHFRHSLLQKKETTDALQLGIATHTAAYEPERFRDEVLRWEGDRRGAEWKVFEAANRGKVILKAEAFDLALAMATAARNDHHAGKYLARGKAEQTVLWTYDKGGRNIRMKSRLDFVSNEGPITDLKTTRNASPRKFGQQANELLYHAQAAIYRDALASIEGQEREYLLLPVEKPAPHVVQIYFLGESTLDLGRETYTRLLDQWWACKEENHWPGYMDGPLELELPRLAYPDEEDAEGLGVTFDNEVKEA